MKSIIDFHVHPDPAGFPTAEACLAHLRAEMRTHGVEKSVLLQLNSQAPGNPEWSRESIGKALKNHPEILGFVSVNPATEDGPAVLEKHIRNHGYKGLKLHPRLDRFGVRDSKTVELVRHAGRMGLPVLIDAFPDGISILDGFDPRDYGLLCQACPETRIVVAHFGGYRVLDFLLLAKRVPNMYLNFAYTLLYFRGSSVTSDLVYAIRSMKGERIFYGSDFPDRGFGETLALSLEELRKHRLPEGLIEKVMGLNAKAFLEHYGL